MNGTLDLYEIHHHPDRLAKLHELQRDRLNERVITGGDRPRGLRLSIADPVRRVKAYFDPFWTLHIDDGVGERGHVLEDYLEVALFHTPGARYERHPYETQAPIQWHQNGRSAFDFVVRTNGPDRVVSCKSSIRGLTPTSANVEQERRMMALAGFAAGSVFEVWVIDPSAMRAHGPHEYELAQEHIDAARKELRGVTDAVRHFEAFTEPTSEPEWNDPEWWRGLGLVSNSGAFRLETLDASGAIEARNRLYLRARAKAAEAKREEDEAKALIRRHVEEQLAAARAAGREVKGVRAFSGDQEATYAIDKRGAMRVTLRDVREAQAVA